MRLLHFTVTSEQAGRQVGHLLRGALGLSYSLVQSLKWHSGAILLNGRSVTLRTTVQVGDKLTVDIADRHTAPPPAENVPPPQIVYEDEDLLILNKPAGVAVHAASFSREAVTVEDMVRGYLGGGVFHPINRLDRGVSGLMAVAKNAHAHARCMALLHTEQFRREYWGICRGCPQPEEGDIRLPIARDRSSTVKRCIHPDGRASHTHYAVERRCGGVTLLRLRPITGRTHQLRLHLSAIGHPLLGDWLYGTETSHTPQRVALHSCDLWLTQPLTGAEIHLTAPLPPDLAALLG